MMNKRRRVLAAILVLLMMTGMMSCMKHYCPAYAYKTEKTQNNKG